MLISLQDKLVKGGYSVDIKTHHIIPRRQRNSFSKLLDLFFNGNAIGDAMVYKKAAY